MDAVIKELALKIGEFYLKKYEGNEEAAQDEIVRLRITELVFESKIGENKLTIKTSRPGLMIGRRGEIVGQLADHLQMSLHIEENRESVTDYLLQGATKPDVDEGSCYDDLYDSPYPD